MTILDPSGRSRHSTDATPPPSPGWAPVCMGCGWTDETLALALAHAGITNMGRPMTHFVIPGLSCPGMLLTFALLCPDCLEALSVLLRSVRETTAPDTTRA